MSEKVKYFFDTEFIEDGSTIDLISIGIVSSDGREYYAINADCDWTRADPWVKENVLSHLPPKQMNLSDPSIGPRIKDEFMKFRRRETIRNEIFAFVSFSKPEFWAYYADYDWVVLCQLFGRMIDLPKGWPMYCMDLKQLCVTCGDPKLPKQEQEHHALYDARWVRDMHAKLTTPVTPTELEVEKWAESTTPMTRSMAASSSCSKRTASVPCAARKAKRNCGFSVMHCWRCRINA